ncbi:MAG: hypothetical protein ABIO70_13120 [Pseudomonadota bacterium]
MRTLVLALLLSLAPSWAWAEASLPEPLAAAVAEAGAQGLPVGALEAKAREGLAKGVEPARIQAVLAQMAADLAAVDTLLREHAHAPDREALLLGAGAARAAGLSDASLLLLARAPEAARGRGLQSVADLLRLGFSEAEAVALVRHALATDVPLEALAVLATNASLLVSSGLTPSVAAQQLSSPESAGKTHPLANVPPQSRSDLPEPAQDSHGKGPGKGPK